MGAAEPPTFYLVASRRLLLTYWVGFLSWIDHHELYYSRHQELEQQQTVVNAEIIQYICPEVSPTYSHWKLALCPLGVHRISLVSMFSLPGRTQDCCLRVERSVCDFPQPSVIPPPCQPLCQPRVDWNLLNYHPDKGV